MRYWIFPTNTKKFRMNDWLTVSNVVEFVQNRNVEVNDIVYLYSTKPIAQIQYKMIIEKINIPYEETIDDSAYSTTPLQTNAMHKNSKFCRLKYLKHIVTDELSLSSLRLHGVKSCFQGSITVSPDLVDYIETCFNK